jgi:hypothetical protein
MASPTTPHENETPQEPSRWAHDVTTLKVGPVPAGAINMNVDGRRVAGPLKGFGPMWQKIYRVRLTGVEVAPEDVIATWKQNFSQFWPKGNRFYAPLTGITPGEVALLNLTTGGMPLSTGVLVLYADDESFTLMTPQGHMFAGWITFSSFKDDSCTIAQVSVLMRASDPIYEMGLRLGGHRAEDKFWQRTLRALAAYFQVDGAVHTQVTCVDRRLQWSYAGNVWQNAGIRTTLSAPTRWFRRRR